MSAELADPRGQPHEIVPEGYQRRWWILAVLCLSLLVIGLDNRPWIGLTSWERDSPCSGRWWPSSGSRTERPNRP